MNMKRGFTLIELLVVIAIIAVLAAILFPVFAQAKRAAKGTASISNVRQLTLTSSMYSTDNDDKMVLSTAYNTGQDPLKFGDSSAISPWSWLIVPYVKSGSLYDDPAGDPTPNLFSFSELVSKIVVSQYGYNYAYLSPNFVDVDGIVRQTTVPLTGVNDPAGTVMLTSKFAYDDSAGLKRGDFFTLGDFGAALWTTVETPFCDRDNNVLCAGSWGHNDGFVNDPTLEGLSDVEAGAFSGGVSTRAGGAIVSFVDGHAKKLSLGALAAGTNWNPQIESSSVLKLDKSKYLWDIE